MFFFLLIELFLLFFYLFYHLTFDWFWIGHNNLFWFTFYDFIVISNKYHEIWFILNSASICFCYMSLSKNLF